MAATQADASVEIKVQAECLPSIIQPISVFMGAIPYGMGVSHVVRAISKPTIGAMTGEMFERVVDPCVQQHLWGDTRRSRTEIFRAVRTRWGARQAVKKNCECLDGKLTENSRPGVFYHKGLRGSLKRNT